MEKDNTKPSQNMNNYMKYSAIGFQIGGSLAGGALIGYFIDKKMGNEQPYAMAGLSILFLFGGMYIAFKDFIKPPKK